MHGVQTFRQLCLLEEPALAAVVQAASGQSFCVRKGSIVKASYDEVAEGARLAPADSGNVLMHAADHGSVEALVLHGSSSRFNDGLSNGESGEPHQSNCQLSTEPCHACCRWPVQDSH